MARLKESKGEYADRLRRDGASVAASRQHVGGPLGQKDALLLTQLQTPLHTTL